MKPSSLGRLAVLKIVLIYAFFGCIWIYFSDTILGWLIHDSSLMTRISMSKGIAFIVITSILLYVLISRYMEQNQEVLGRLQESEAAYRIMFSQSPFTVTLNRTTGEYVEVNDRFLESLGLQRSDVLGRKPTELGLLDPEAQERIYNEFLRCGGSLDQFEISTWAPGKDHMRHSLISSRIINVKGEPMVLTLVNDITKRKEAENALRENEGILRSLLAATPVGVALLKDRVFYKVNSSLCRITGYTEKEMVGMMTRILYPDEGEFLRVGTELYRQMQQEGLGVKEAVLQRKDGELIDVVLSLSPFDPDDFSAGVCATVLDITERKKTEEEREKLQGQLIQAQKMESVGRLAGGVAHDFNNMLSVIIGNTEIALAGMDTSDPFQKVMQDILHAGRRSADLTRQLLAFARKQTVSPKVLDLNDTVSGMLKMLRRLIGEDVDLAWMPGHNLWNIFIDPSQVDQLLANLTVNARDAIEGTGKIVIETSNTLCDEEYCSGQPECIPGEYVILAVSDDGCGMDKETIANIFEPFFTTKKEGKGTGLGLATVYGIVKQNRGFVNVYSEPGKGTTFRIYLPRYVSDAADELVEKEEQEIRKGRETVLVVEDEESVLNLSKNMLERLGYTVLAVRKPDQAISLAGQHDGDIDLLFTDVVMPDMNGKELARRIASLRPEMKCLYMSGYTANVIAHHGILDRGVHFIPKPFSFRELARKIREVLD